ncbi:Metallo-dependent hydrolase [Morchella conica CCBAS932]|uniref:Probable guanine deaminase n=1 Tax=Morchella conica CCBAS932 TaxID=1392247 RepID=A0A3N4KHJ6_9PEZI|nr:Metallo-dependent hydrolase [Morchella conica CCBAS932]
MAIQSVVLKTIYVGTFIHSVSLAELQVLKRSAVAVDESGKILLVEHPVEASMLEMWAKEAGTTIVEAGPGQFFFPGLIDTHIHASQYPNSGIFGKSTLLDWLNTYTFPLEASLAKPSKAKRVYSRCVARTLSHGTTTAAYYATRDVTSTNILATTCHTAGQRAFVGRCCMDCMAPDYYRDTDAATSLADTIKCAEFCAKLDPKGELVQSIITPRFAPSCSRELMRDLGDFMAQSGLLCQTHISENKGEIELVASLFPECKNYATVYDRAGLLSEKTVLAHAVHLTDDEIALVKMRGSKISHCPVSNAALTSGAAKVRRLLDEGIVVGLGTDVSGGYSPSVLEAARQATMTSRFVSLTEGEEAKLSVEEALYLATRGGAEVLGLQKTVGAFEVGMEWDALLVGCTFVPDEEECDEDEDLLQAKQAVGGGMTPVDLFGWENWEEMVAKWLYSGDDRNVLKVWVKGRKVHEKPA